MPKNRLVLDTNTVIKIFSSLISIKDFTNEEDAYIIIPGVVYMELLSKNMPDKDIINLQSFLNDFDLAEASLHEYIVASELRRNNKGLKTPDAIIAATAKTKQATLVTADELLLKIKDIKTMRPFIKNIN